MKKITVRYSVEYECELDISPEENVEDRISDIDIPEGGCHNSKYVLNSFIWLSRSDSGQKSYWSVLE